MEYNVIVVFFFTCDNYASVWMVQDPYTHGCCCYYYFFLYLKIVCVSIRHYFRRSAFCVRCFSGRKHVISWLSVSTVCWADDCQLLLARLSVSFLVFFSFFLVFFAFVECLTLFYARSAYVCWSPVFYAYCFQNVDQKVLQTNCAYFSLQKWKYSATYHCFSLNDFTIMHFSFLVWCWNVKS